MESNSVQKPEQGLWGHPKGLYVLFFAELWERFSYYGMRALLTLYMVDKVFHALANRDVVAAVIYSSYGSLIYTAPSIGGKIADHIYGYRKSIILGGILMSIGHFVLAFESNITFFVALAFLIVGNGFFKPNVSSFVGDLYEHNEIKKDAGFTIFYMGINIGAFIAPLLCGWVASTWGWHYGFALAGFGMLLGLLVFVFGTRGTMFGDKGFSPKPEKLQEKKYGLKVSVWIPLLAILLVPAVAILISHYHFIGGGDTFLGEVTIVNVLFYFMTVSFLAYVGYEMYRSSKEDRGKLLVAVLLTLFMALFWGFQELSGSVITLFAARNVSLPVIDLSSLSMGVWRFGAAETNSINPFFIIALSVPVSILWTWLDKRKINPRTPFKFSFGLAILAVGFLIAGLSKVIANPQGYVPFVILIILYFFISLGELFMSPVGLSKITSLSPKRLTAFMMGVWFLSSAYAFQIVGFIAKSLAISAENGKEVQGWASLDIYLHGFYVIAEYAGGAALIILILSPWMKRLMHDVH